MDLKFTTPLPQMKIKLTIFILPFPGRTQNGPQIYNPHSPQMRTY
jgi:hypothetical protein